MKPKICFVIPQFGIMPGYVDFFIRTASYSAPMLDFVFFTDQPVQRIAQAPNVFFRKMTIQEFMLLACRKLGFDFTISSAYKLCDIKPMYGLIFEDYIAGYTHWGHCDFDMIFGNVNKLLSDYKFDEFDIFSTQKIYASGPFLIFKNVEKVNRFFMNSPSWQYVLSHPQYQGFDEAGDVIKELWKGRDISECPAKIHSMTHLLLNVELLKKLQIKVNMKELITEKFTEGTKICFDQGKLFLQPANEELYIYHFMNRKNKTAFNEVLFNKETNTFTFSDKGFNTGNKVEFAVGLVLSLIKRYWIRLIRKIKSKFR